MSVSWNYIHPLCGKKATCIVYVYVHSCYKTRNTGRHRLLEFELSSGFSLWKTIVLLLPLISILRLLHEILRIIIPIDTDT